MTESEEIVESFLLSENINFQKIAECAQKTPDYRVQLGSHVSYWEVKELSENPSEKQILREIEDENSGLYQVNSARVVNSIKDAAKQLKGYGDKSASRVIVLCDTRDFATMDFLFIPTVQAAMFGNVQYFAHKDGSLVEVNRSHGLFTNRRRYVSAVAVISKRSKKILFLHNHNAVVSAVQSDFLKYFDNHLILSKEDRGFQWQQV